MLILWSLLYHVNEMGLFLMLNNWLQCSRMNQRTWHTWLQLQGM
jgi:hypothetical protein